MLKELLTDTSSSSENERTDEKVPQKQVSSKWMDASDNDGDVPAVSVVHAGLVSIPILTGLTTTVDSIPPQR
jgi:hypothetical protein